MSHVSRYALGISLTAMLAGCSGSPLPGTMQATQVASATRPLSANEDLVYVADRQANTVSIYSWSGKLLRTLKGFISPRGLCSDARGDVYVVDGLASDIVEYAHGLGRRMRTLGDPAQQPADCSVDPKTGNLAVTNFKTLGKYGQGSIAIYVKAKGKPEIYRNNQLLFATHCGYDDNGDLFADGYAPYGRFWFAELTTGKSKLINLKIDRSIGSPGGVQWDGKYVVVDDAFKSRIYRLTISGSNAKVKGSTKLEGIDIWDFWLQGSRVIAGQTLGGYSPRGDVEVWNYPTGGEPIRKFGSLQFPQGVTVSVPPE